MRDRSFLTRTALERFGLALPAPGYRVTIIDTDAGSRPETRQYSHQQLVQATQYLRHRNARGANIYLRPNETAHVLIDDLDPDSLEQFTRDHSPAVIVETSPANFQCWLTVSPEPVDPGLASAAARLLAGRYGGDPGAASAVQHGRAPGLTNRKACHERRDGSFPWAILHHAARLVDPAGAALLHDAAATRCERKGTGTAPTSPTLMLQRTPGEEHAAATRMVRAMLPAGAAVDRSRLDYAVARRQVARGVAPGRIEAVILAGARASSMRGVEAEDYARRTVAAALRAHGRPPPD